MVFRANVIKAFALTTFLLSVAMVSVLSTSALLNAGPVTTALYTIQATTANTGSVDLDDIQSGLAISGESLIADNFIDSNALNAIIHKGNVDVPGMPPTAAIQVEGAVQNDGGVFTEYTTEAQSATLNDLPLLPPLPAVDDAWYFGCDNPCRILTTDIDTVGVGTWTITYEYWDGVSYVALSNVDDRSSGFTVLGRRSATWDMPSDWDTQTVTGSSVNSFWGRARVSAFSSVTTQPLGSKQEYENGQWWTWIEDLDVNNQEQVTLFLGGSTDLVTAHQTFPGTAGITTGDAAGLELGNAYSIGLEGRLDFSVAGSSTYVLNKTGAITINVSGSAVSPAIGTIITGAGSSFGDVTGITVPATGEQVIIVASDGTSAATWVNAGGGMTSYDVQTITDTGNNLTWVSNSGVDYFDKIQMDTSATPVFDFDKTFADFSTGTLVNTAAYTGALGLAN